MNKWINPESLRPGDIILCRDNDTPRCIQVNGEIYGNWEDAFLYLGENKVLYGYVPHVHPLQSLLTAYDIFGVFRATPCLTQQETERIIHVAMDLAGLCPTWYERLVKKIKKALGIRVFPKFGRGVNKPEELLASGYEAAGRKISSVVPWKMELHHIDGSAILVRVF